MLKKTKTENKNKRLNLETNEVLVKAPNDIANIRQY